jgi:hypothetical protein
LEGYPVPEGYKYGDLQVGGASKFGTIKFGVESFGTQTQDELHCLGPTANYRLVFSSERV